MVSSKKITTVFTTGNHSDLPIRTTLHISEDIRSGQSYGLKRLISDAIAEGHRDIVLNLRGVASIDASGIGALVAALVTVQKAGGKLTLMEVNRRVRLLLQITKLYEMFDL